MPSPAWMPSHVQFTLIHGPNISGSYPILFFTALDFTFTTRHIHSWASFPLWARLFILSEAISPLFSSSILDTFWPGQLIFQCHIFLPFHTVHGSSQGKNAEVVCHSLLQWTTFCQNSPPWHVCLGWTCMAHSFIELHKAVIHMIILVSFLWLWFSFWRVWSCRSCFFHLASERR